jgi:hypothetical protein
VTKGLRSRRIIILPTIGVTIAIVVFLVLIPQLNSEYDKYGIKKIYATKIGGRVWFINMRTPRDDGFFKPTVPIRLQPDGSWQTDAKYKIGKHEDIRMIVTTPSSYDEWKNVEVTGYVKVISSQSKNSSLEWSARGAVYNGSNPCADTGIGGGLYVNGTPFWQKTVYHDAHTNKISETSVTYPLIGRWIGWKVVLFNIRNDTAVRMISYIDDKDNGTWTKISDSIDNGKWYVHTLNNKIYATKCKRTANYEVTNPGDVVSFSSEDMIWNFKNLSVREIEAS